MPTEPSAYLLFSAKPRTEEESAPKVKRVVRFASAANRSRCS
jgi:hypothetical protein